MWPTGHDHFYGTMIDCVCGWKCPVSSFVEVCFIVVIYGENVLWIATDICRYLFKYYCWPLGQLGNNAGHAVPQALLIQS